MFHLISFLLFVTGGLWHVNARILPADSTALSSASVFQPTKRDSSIGRQMYIARNKDGCLVPSEIVPNTKRNDESGACVGCSNLFDDDPAAMLPSGYPDNWNDALESENAARITGIPATDENLNALFSENSISDDTSKVLNGLGEPYSGALTMSSTPDFSGKSEYGLDDAFKIAAERPEIPEWCGSPGGLDVYSVHLMEQWSDWMLPVYQHQSIVVSAIDTVYDIRYHIDGNKIGLPMNYRIDENFRWARIIITRFELRGWIVPQPPAYETKEAALRLWEDYVEMVPLPIVEPESCENCQTWAADVLQKVKECPTYVAMPDMFTVPANP